MGETRVGPILSEDLRFHDAAISFVRLLPRHTCLLMHGSMRRAVLLTITLTCDS